MIDPNIGKITLARSKATNRVETLIQRGATKDRRDQNLPLLSFVAVKVRRSLRKKHYTHAYEFRPLIRGPFGFLCDLSYFVFCVYVVPVICRLGMNCLRWHPIDRKLLGEERPLRDKVEMVVINQQRHDACGD
jgi:hypothetical protein